MQRRLVTYWRVGTVYWSVLQGHDVHGTLAVLTLEMGPVRCSKPSATYQATLRKNPEGDLNSNGGESLRSVNAGSTVTLVSEKMAAQRKSTRIREEVTVDFSRLREPKK